jgi:cell division transport system permease protein
MRRRALFIAVLPVALAGCSLLQSKAEAGPVEAVVYLTDTATQDEQAAVQRALQAAHGVTAVAFVSRERAYRQFRKDFKKNKDLVGSVGPESFPNSFRFRATDRKAADAALAAVRKLPGVDKANVLPSSSPSASPR